jgi:hypothetical protein
MYPFFLRKALFVIYLLTGVTSVGKLCGLESTGNIFLIKTVKTDVFLQRQTLGIDTYKVKIWLDQMF